MWSSDRRDLDQLFCCLNKCEWAHKQWAKRASLAQTPIWTLYLQEHRPAVYISELSAQISSYFLFCPFRLFNSPAGSKQMMSSLNCNSALCYRVCSGWNRIGFIVPVNQHVAYCLLKPSLRQSLYEKTHIQHSDLAVSLCWELQPLANSALCRPPHILCVGQTTVSWLVFGSVRSKTWATWVLIQSHKAQWQQDDWR